MRSVACGLILGVAAGALGAQPAPPNLSERERAWLAAHPVIRIGVDPAYAPYAFIDGQGQYAGISAEISALVSARLGVRLELVRGLSWPQVLEAARRREIDLITTAAHRPGREAYLGFTRIYLPTPTVVMTRDTTPRLRDLSELNQHRMALVKANSSSKAVMERFRAIDPLFVATPLAGLQAVSQGHAQAFIGVLGINTHLASRHGISNLKVNAGFDMANGQRYGVRSDWPELLPLLEKALDAIPQPRLQAIFARWIPVAIESIETPGAALDASARERLLALPELRVGAQRAGAPFDFVDAEGQHAGLSADMLALLSQSLGLRSRVVAAPDMARLRSLFARGEIDLISAVNMPSAEVPAAVLSEAYFKSALGVFVRRGDVFLGDMRDLNDRRVAVRKGGIAEEVLGQYPRIALQTHAELLGAAKALQAGQADYLVAETSSALRVLEELGLAGLSYAGPLTEAPVNLRIAVSPRLEGLLPLINASLGAITADEAAAVRKRWVGAHVAPDLQLRPALRWAGAALLLIILGYAAFYIANRRLRQEVARRVQSEAALRKANEQRERAEQRHRDTIDASPSALLVVASDGLIVQATAQMAELAGYARDALIGQPALRLVPLRDRAKFLATFATFIRSPAPQPAQLGRYSQLLRRDGSEIPVEASIHPTVTNAGVVAIVTVVDVSARFDAERRLRASEERFRDLFDSANDLIQMVDPQGRFAYVNRSWCVALGYSAEEASSMRFGDIVAPGSQAHCDQLFGQILGGEDVGVVETVFQTRDGRRLEVEGAISLRLHDGQPDATRGIFRDVTQRNRQMAELAEARRRAELADRTKSTFLATMSHELRTPLNSIIGFTGVLRQGLAGPLTDEQTKQLGMVQGSAKHLLALINDVLDISKIEAGELKVDNQPFALPASIAKVMDIVRPMAQAKGLTLAAAVEPGLGSLMGDARRVEQVLLNLLNNAIKFTAVGTVELQARQSEQGVQLRVVDTGMGIKAEDLATLFQPFRQIDDALTRSHEGTGLGLAICRRLAHLMGGDVVAQSEWGQGSSFTFELPLHAKGGL